MMTGGVSTTVAMPTDRHEGRPKGGPLLLQDQKSGFYKPAIVAVPRLVSFLGM